MALKHELSDFLGILPAVLYEYVLYPDGSAELLYLSPSSKEILGEPPEYFLEDVNRFWEMVHPNDGEQARVEDVRANQAGELFKAADTALYRAKSDQCNCVRVAVYDAQL
jgi:hypothetical protein